MNVQFDLNNFYMYKNQDWMSSKGYIRNSHVPKMWEKLKFSTTVFSKLWLLFFFLSLMITPVRYQCPWCFHFDNWNRLTSDIQDFKSSFKLCISQGLRAVTQVSGYISPFPVLSIFFMCSNVQYIDSYLDKLFYTSL